MRQHAAQPGLRPFAADALPRRNGDIDAPPGDGQHEIAEPAGLMPEGGIHDDDQFARRRRYRCPQARDVDIGLEVAHVEVEIASTLFQGGSKKRIAGEAARRTDDEQRDARRFGQAGDAGMHGIREA
jgi:hypothetical protein